MTPSELFSVLVRNISFCCPEENAETEVCGVKKALKTLVGFPAASSSHAEHL